MRYTQHLHLASYTLRQMLGGKRLASYTLRQRGVGYPLHSQLF